MEQVYTYKHRLASLEREMNNMKRTINFQNNQIKSLQNRKEFRCESGTITHFKKTWPYKRSVTFKTPFRKAPTVTQGLSLVDSSQTKNVRIHSYVHRITNKGFEAVQRTWADTILYGAQNTWMACGY